jgi:5,10-methylenetetrahydrofolate reductase
MLNRQTLNSFSEKVRQKRKTVLYELLPPPKNLSKKDIEKSISTFMSMISNLPIDGVNIPEVREEKRNGKRGATELIKLEPRIVASYIKKHKMTDLIINRPVVYLPWEKQGRWLEELLFDYKIHNIVLVGGESSKIKYPGPSVAEAASKIKQDPKYKFEDILLGGITIPTRENEPFRVLQKANAGIEFFTTQILYESYSIKKFIKKYWQLCLKKNTDPKMIFLSFAPISSNRDIELLAWLGVDIPKKVLNLLTTGWIGAGWRSLQVCQDVLEDTLNFIEKEKIGVPIGINVEHVSKHNFEISFLLLERLLTLYDKNRQKKRTN